jgi:hypothetical protein
LRSSDVHGDLAQRSRLDERSLAELTRGSWREGRRPVSRSHHPATTGVAESSSDSRRRRPWPGPSCKNWDRRDRAPARRGTPRGRTDRSTRLRSRSSLRAAGPYSCSYSGFRRQRRRGPPACHPGAWVPTDTAG